MFATRQAPLNDYDGGSGGTYQQIGSNKEFENEDEKSEVQEVEVLDGPPNHDPGQKHSQFFQNKLYYSRYPLGLRLSNTISQLASCSSPDLTYVDILKKAESELVDAFSMNHLEKELITEKVNIIMKINSTSQLRLDTNILHPFVRIHIVNLENGAYISKPKKDMMKQHEPSVHNAVYNFESNCITLINNGERERKSCELELVTPFSTNFCDMRKTSNSRCHWDDEIMINIPAETIFHWENLILFELLDFHHGYLERKSDQLDVDNYYRIAWGYLRPLGLSRIHLGQLKIQLHEYVFDTSQFRTDRREYIPLVYYDFIFPKKAQYDGVLNIQIETQLAPEIEDVQKHHSMNVYQIERGETKARTQVQQQIVREEKIEELSDQEKLNLRRRRYRTDKSDIVPDKIAFKFASAPLGCYRLVFNKQGNYLAAACTYKNSKTVIKLFDIESGLQFATYKGHRNIIHDLNFSINGAYLSSASSDYTVKIWSVPKQSGENISEEESDLYLIATLQHPSYVYGTIFLTDGRVAMIATACFDSRLRIWSVDMSQSMQVIEEPSQQEVISLNGVNFDVFNDLKSHRHPNCLVYDGLKNLYVGDSLGAIHLYYIDLNSANYCASRQQLILNEELEGDPINAITLVPPEYQDLLVHSRDNCIRILDYKSSENEYRGEAITGSVTTRLFGTVSQKVQIRSVMSPKGEFILAGSETGKPYLWLTLGLSQPTEQFQYNLIGPITDVAWNEQYHMIAIAGFGDEHPIVVYTWQRPEDMNYIEAKQLLDESKTQERQEEDIQVNFSPSKPRIELFKAQQTAGPFGTTNLKGPFDQDQLAGGSGSQQILRPPKTVPPLEKQPKLPFGNIETNPIASRAMPFGNNSVNNIVPQNQPNTPIQYQQSNKKPF